MQNHDQTTLILLPGLRPPVPSRPERLGKRRPAAGLARRGDLGLALGLALAAIAVTFTLSVPSGIAVTAFLAGQATARFRRTGVEVHRG